MTKKISTKAFVGNVPASWLLALALAHTGCGSDEAGRPGGPDTRGAKTPELESTNLGTMTEPSSAPMGGPVCNAREALSTGLTCEELGISIAPDFRSQYSCEVVGSVPGVVGGCGGDSSGWMGPVLTHPKHQELIWVANYCWAGGAVYELQLARGSDCRIHGFASATAEKLFDAPEMSIGGVGLLDQDILFYAGFTARTLHQRKTNGSGITLVTELAELSSHPLALLVSATLVPPGMPGAQRLKLMDAEGSWYDLPYTKPDSDLLSVDTVQRRLGLNLEASPLGVAYVEAGNFGFPQPGLLLVHSKVSNQEVLAYDVDSQGDPLLGSRRVFASGLPGAPKGAWVDPWSGDFLFGNAVSGLLIAIHGLKSSSARLL